MLGGGIGPRPPITESVAAAIGQGIKNSEAKSTTSEVPLAFQHAPRASEPAVVRKSRRVLIVTMVAFLLLAVLLAT